MECFVIIFDLIVPERIGESNQRRGPETEVLGPEERERYGCDTLASKWVRPTAGVGWS